MVAKSLPSIGISIEEWLAATTFEKYCTLKKLFPATKYKEKLHCLEEVHFLTS